MVDIICNYRPALQPILQSVAATSGDEPCCDWVGEDGAGHYVKMVHNGIEYGDMQMICEAYQIMKEGLGLTSDEMGSIFEKWNTGDLDSFLIEITRDIMKYKDTDGKPLVEKIRDTAGQVFGFLSYFRKELVNGPPFRLSMKVFP